MELIIKFFEYIFDSLKDFAKNSPISFAFFVLGSLLLIYGISSEPLGITSTISPLLIIIIALSCLSISLLTYYFPPVTSTKGQKLTNQTVPTKKVVQEKKLYTFVGNLEEEPKPNSRFQNFCVDRLYRRENPNPIYFMWADTYKKNYINAFVEEPHDPKTSYLKVLFLNNPDSYPSNIAIMPYNHSPIQPTAEKIYITFEAKVLEMSEEEESYNQFLYQGQDKKSLSEIGISIRLVDAELQHWTYSVDGKVPRLGMVHSKDNWQELAIDIKVEKNEKKWRPFEEDGNYLYGSKKPNFSVIALVFLEFGGNGELGLKEGFGSIAIRDIRLKSDDELSSNVQKI